ncbi:MAG: RagB/SusD family nutrient uptake outer membrane protein, partial [Sphingobacteriaceae bacterium]
TARQALKMVRDRASTALPAVTAADVTGFRNALKHDRRIELAFEDHRYWDLLRWKDAETVLNQPIQGVTVTKNANNTYSYSVVNVATRTFRNPAMYYYPFSQTQIVNSKGTLAQNPGY